MTTYYVDFTNGNDSHSGTSFANRKQTLTSATASTVPGDSIRVMGSPNATSLGQTATFTNQGTVVLSSAVTTPIYLDGSWTASSNVTCSTDPSNKREGANSSKNVIGGGFTTGIVSYYNTGTLNLSNYQQVTFWIYSNTQISSGVFKIRLSTTTGGSTATHELTINQTIYASAWHPITLNLGANMNSAIQSVALVAISNPGSITVWLDCMLACKAVSSPDSLTLNSLIGKNDGEWWGIQVIESDSVTIILDQNVAISSNQGYSGITGSFTCYKRECIVNSQNGCEIASSGSAGNLISISGGWDTTAMSSQSLDGTFCDGLNDLFNGFDVNSQSYISLNKMSFYRYNLGLNSNSNFNIFSNINIGVCPTPITVESVASQYSNINILSNGNPSTASNAGNIWTNINWLSNLEGPTIGSNEKWLGITSNNNASYGMQINGNSNIAIYNAVINDTTAGNGVNIGSAGVACDNVIFYGLSTTNNLFSDISISGGSTVVVYNANLGGGDFFNTSDGLRENPSLWFQYDTGIGTTHKGVYYGGTISSDISTRHISSGFSWKFSPTDSTFFDSINPLSKQVAYIPIPANTTRTISVWCYRSSTNITQTIRIFGGRIPGVGSVGTDITANNTGAANTWTEVTLASITPTVDCVIEVYNECYSSDNTSSCWTHDILTA